jgi:predicted type IV restriction endonuclease
MQELIELIRERLAQGAYPSEAAISHGVVTPILNGLGWDSADPGQLVPEFRVPSGRVDFAVLGSGRRPCIFIEVKGVGRAMDGDRQLFQYAFHQGVPLCVLTDGREWSFYLPAGQGSYEDRRIYRLQLDDRDPAECERVLNRYLARDRVRDGSAFEDAQRDYKDAAGRREAVATLPRAWANLMSEPEELLLDIIIDKTEALSGYRPAPDDVLAFLQRLKPVGSVPEAAGSRTIAATSPMLTNTSAQTITAATTNRTVAFTAFGQSYSCPTASGALVEVLRLIVARDPARVDQLAQAVGGRKRSRNLIARTVAEINPSRPDLARAEEFAPGWLVGLNISNREKMTIIRAACDLFAVRMPQDVDIHLPNAQ